MMHSEAAYDALAQSNPAELASIIDARSMPDAALTFAAEAMGNARDSEMARAALITLLRHPSAVVREGAILGIQRHLDAASRLLLSELLDDASPAVRVTARDAIEDFDQP